MHRLNNYWLVLVCMLAASSTTNASKGAAVDEIRQTLSASCYSCHGEAAQQAGIHFPALLADRPLVRNREIWQRAIRALESGGMPPQGAVELAEDDRVRLVNNLDSVINHFDYSGIKDPGFEPLRRLTHTEYDNTVRDLIGIDLKPARRFSDEMAGETGFDNSATTLHLQSSLMERYIAAAERLVEEALPAQPQAVEHRRAYMTVFSTLPGEGVGPTEAAKKTLRRFLRRAFRRQPTNQEMTRALALYRSGRESGLDFEQSLKAVVSGTLISPSFLMRVEATKETDRAWQIDDWELASRLSYFLWASMPDDELFDLADRNQLHEPQVLLAQLDRMLADPRADSLGTVMAAQWLGFGRVGRSVRMGAIDHPWCTDSLMDAMRAESSMFFMSLLREDAPISRLVDADYSYVNQEIAETLYDMKGIYGSHMRRVALKDQRRGGVLGHGTTLAITSNYNQTSPVKRGHWILETLLGTPPPPPPPNASVFDQEVSKDKQLTFREKLAMHSEQESCRSCHSQFDPLGFSLENFSYFGQWRDNYTFRIRIKKPEDINYDPESNFRRVTKAIDVSGTLPEGASFDGPAGLKQVLVEHRHDDLVRQTVSKTLAYALGRPLEYYDEPTIRNVIASLEANEFRFRTLLREIVQSYPFLYKKHPSDMETQ